jgi:hypothetical protein
MRILPNQFPRLACYVGTLLALISSRGAAQGTADSASSSKVTDSTASGYGDTARQAGVDTLRAKSGPDSLKAASSRGESSDSMRPAAAAVPADTVLSGACSSARPGTPAPGLLLVLFRDAATQKDRFTAVATAGGVRAGTAPGGGDYVRPSADTISSRDLADRLVQDPAVASISERTCPTTR